MPFIVVSDCSPIRALHHLGLLSLLTDLYGKIIVPKTVQLELLRPTNSCPAIDITNQPGLDIRAAKLDASTAGVPLDLDPGETEAITLAIEIHANLLLMDERKGTSAARQLGLHTIGVIGVLLEAKRKGKINSILPLIDRLTAELSFFISPSLRNAIAQLADE